jgi:hypothetical protein
MGPMRTSTPSRRPLPPMLSAVLALTALASVALTACGGGSGASSSAQSSSSATSATAASPKSTTAAAGTYSSRSSPRSSAKQEGSASFRVKSGDNSIPDFGSEAATSERKLAGAALAAYLRARSKGDWSAACSYLLPTVRTQLEKLAGASKGKVKGCTGVLAALEAHTPPIARADALGHSLAALRIKDGHGFALFYGPHNQKYVMPMSEEGGAWKVGQLAPIAYPLGSQPQGSSSQPSTSP